MLLLLLMFLIMFLSIAYMVRKRSKTILLITICLTATAVFVLQIFNIFFYQHKNILLDDDVLLVLSQQDWIDENKLNELGFEYFGDDIGYVAHHDGKNFLCSIVLNIQEDNYPSLKRQFQNISYEAYESKSSLFNINRLFIKEKSVRRYCTIHIKNIQISVFEDNEEKTPIAFQDFL